MLLRNRRGWVEADKVICLRAALRLELNQQIELLRELGRVGRDVPGSRMRYWRILDTADIAKVRRRDSDPLLLALIAEHPHRRHGVDGARGARVAVVQLGLADLVHARIDRHVGSRAAQGAVNGDPCGTWATESLVVERNGQRVDVRRALLC